MTGTCVRSLTDADFEREVLAETRPVLVDFYRDNCPPCMAATPILEAICVQGSDELKVVKINTDHCPLAAARHRIGAVPTFVLYRHGKILGASTGLQGRTVFTNWVNGLLSKP